MPSPTQVARRKNSGHTRARAPLISLDGPGRIRVAGMLALLGVSHSHFYSGLKSGRYPLPDGRDGKMPWWSTQSVKQILEPSSTSGQSLQKHSRTK
jgi:hypothetical protein